MCNCCFVRLVFVRSCSAPAGACPSIRTTSFPAPCSIGLCKGAADARAPVGLDLRHGPVQHLAVQLHLDGLAHIQLGRARTAQHVRHRLADGLQRGLHVGAPPLVAHHRQKRPVGRQHRALCQPGNLVFRHPGQVHAKALAAVVRHPVRNLHTDAVQPVDHRVQAAGQRPQHEVHQINDAVHPLLCHADHGVPHAFKDIAQAAPGPVPVGGEHAAHKLAQPAQHPGDAIRHLGDGSQTVKKAVHNILHRPGHQRRKGVGDVLQKGQKRLGPQNGDHFHHRAEQKGQVFPKRGQMLLPQLLQPGHQLIQHRADQFVIERLHPAAQLLAALGQPVQNGLAVHRPGSLTAASISCTTCCKKPSSGIR